MKRPIGLPQKVEPTEECKMSLPVLIQLIRFKLHCTIMSIKNGTFTYVVRSLLCHPTPSANPMLS